MNPYQVLGLQPGASGDDIKRAFRRLASENHPDKNPGDTAKEAQFKQINEAYQMLGDESKRHIYDTRGARPPHINIDDIFSVMNQDFGSIFNHPPIYPGRKVPQQPPVETSHRGDDITVDLNLTLAEAVYGCKKSVAVRSPRPQAVCQVCFGEGGNPGSKRINCTTCGGSGKVVQLGMQFPRITACQVCRGLGSTPITPCHSCGGQGRIVHEAEVLVTVPAGIDKGQQLRLAGRGAPGVPPGDLYLNVLIADHMVFTRSGRNLEATIPVPMAIALNGGEISYVGLNGETQKFGIPPKTQSGPFLVIGHGVHSPLSKTSGDLMANLSIRLPETMTPRAQELVDELAKELAKPA